ncbi:NAD(P)H-quinone oxidoreductase [Dyadobacter psychrophilus]|uniref:Putative NAD(P)H quinone oxidoreductase, PIG3 family n=1 Tax=Dyadobacter psychrophilus TaxID=651661 RepID=A0A1T5HB73_9BACT|nr:NAD(P)H-quinone oxidoreductase [Dyadobacter psychrophilus]SKC17809.1 putative NAD(P)H quinone oxidoreductase, PIG3 family [Dyadobacter psychrophilus]
MKAIVISQPGGPEVLRVEERQAPQPADNEVLIKIYAAGINRPDVFQRKGNYPPPAWAPQDIPGLEVAGIIEQVGVNVADWKKGDAVCALLVGGGYAEYAVAQAGHCLPVPNGFNFVQAASLPETVFTVWHNAFQRGCLKKGENFLVHGGTSGIGITAIQLASTLGAKVFTTAGSEEKCRACLALGAEICINYKTESFEEKLKGEGVDVILDMVGGDYIPKNIRLLREDGRLVFINTMKGSKLEGTEMDFGAIMKKRLSITGSTLRNRNNEFKTALAKEILVNVWPIIQSGKFKTVIAAEFPLHEASKAHALMETSDHIGKIILVNDWES